jgi:uncharacterized protein (TIGR02145 family)
MTKNIFVVKTLCRSIFMMAGIFVFFSAVDVQAFTCGSSISKDGITYGSVVGPDGKCWLDRNLGATRVATSATDTQSYGWLFQWGRNTDGHQVRTSSTTTTLSSTNVPGHGNFIITNTAPNNDWRSPQNSGLWQGVSGINNPCPTGFRLPTQTEWANVFSVGNITNTSTAYSSSLKLTVTGYRPATGVVTNTGNYGYYWSSTPSATKALFAIFGGDSSNPAGDFSRGFGHAVRCIYDGTAVASSSVSTNAVTNITTTTAQGNGNITATGGENPTRYIEWGTTNGSYTHSCTAGTGGTGAYSCNLTNLTPNTTYYVRAYATNSAGTSYGSQVSFTTADVVPFESCGDTIYHEGQIYNTVQIGTQCWFQENLNVGTMLANTSTMPSNNTLIEKWCYDDSNANCTIYGGLYTWAEANQLDPSCNASSCVVPDENQGICPSEWHIPTDDEFKTLELELGMSQFEADATGWRGTDQGSQLSQYALNGTNSSGFSDLLSGYRSTGNFYGLLTIRTHTWSASPSSTTNAWRRQLDSSEVGVNRHNSSKNFGFSIRCLQNATPPLEDTTIQNPTPTKISQAVNDGYFTIDNGTINNTTQATTNVNVTLTNNDKEVTFPQNTTIQETNTNPFNFQNFTLESQNIKDEQPESRSAFRLGIEGTNLTFSQFVTITTFVGEAFNNQTLDILYQNEGETTWNTQGTCTVENGQCTFTTDHATIYTINGTLQSTGDAPLNINTEVLDTLTMDCYESTSGSGTYDVLLGTVSNPGYVTAGTPAIGQSTCTVTTNDDQGYYLTVEDDNGISSTVLTHTDPNTGTLYEIQDLTHWNDTTLTTENWNPPTTKGLGFSIITFPDTDTSNNIFDGIWTETGNCPEGINPDSNDYAGFPDTPQTIAAVPQYTANHTTTTICYKVDVPTSQPSGTYTGSVTYTATSDASSYLN